MNDIRRTSRLRGLVAGSVIAAAMLLAACGSGASNGSSTTSSPGTTPSTTPDTALGSPTTSAPMADGNVITIHNFSFSTPITVPPGATVTVHNTDPTTHSLSSDGGSFDAGNIPAGHTVTFVAPTKPGIYKFHCNFHANMHSTLVVVG